MENPYRSLEQYHNAETFNTITNDMYRYEYTVTFNPKFVDNIVYAEELIEYVIRDIFQIGYRNSKIQRSDHRNSFAFNYVVEYQKNGYPHIHGTLFMMFRLKPQTCANWESSFYRKYGKTAVYSTSLEDKVHTNDHFSGTWQEYISKEGIVTRYFYNPYYTNNTEDYVKL